MTKPRLRIRQSLHGNGTTFTLGYPGTNNWLVMGNHDTRRYQTLAGYRQHLIKNNITFMAASATNVMDQAGFFDYQVSQLP